MYTKNVIEEYLLKVSEKMTNLKMLQNVTGSISNMGDDEKSLAAVKRDSGMESWEWPQGVGLYGLFKYYEISGTKDYLDFIVDWFERKFIEGVPEKNINTMAPMLTLAHVYEVTKKEAYLERCVEWAEWVMKELPRTKEGGFQHIVTGWENKEQLWDDTLFMTVLFLTKMGSLLQKQDYVDESIRQFLIHIKYLYDKKTGLWFHGWTFQGNHNYAEALWARGNCWITAVVADYLEMVEVNGGVKQYIINTITAQVETLSKLQEPDGMWHTLLDDPTSYVETSATAGFGYGILKGVRKGYLDKKYLAVGIKALEAVISNISEDGTVEQVSAGTGMGMDLEHYKKIAINPMAYGQSLTILLLTEGLKL
jgi:unsaturated rhamnogalacturonyl hydrolase